jgi:hypothetical protein
MARVRLSVDGASFPAFRTKRSRSTVRFWSADAFIFDHAMRFIEEDGDT